MGLTGRSVTHVAFVAFPFGGHAATLHTLARHLAASAPTAIFSFLGTTMSNASLATLPALANLKLYDVSDGAPEGYVPSTEEGIDLFLKAVPGNFRDGMEVAAREARARVTCVVGDIFLWLAGKIAEEAGVPWVAVWTSASISLSVHAHTDHIRTVVGVGSQGDSLRLTNQAIHERRDRSLDFIPGLSDFRVRDLQEGVVIGNLNSALSILLHKVGRETTKPTAVVINTIQGLEPETLHHLNTKFETCLPVGPLSLLSRSQLTNPDPFHCLPWLDRQAPASVAYIAFGSMLALPEEELVALANALEATKVPFLLSLKDRYVDRLPSGFVERTTGRGQGLLVSWAPQVEVLDHASVGVFLTHTGWNSVTESIYGGVPMLCRPLFGDQRLNARAASHMWKIGLVAEDGVLTEEWVVGALDLVLRTKEGKKMKERAAKLRELAVEAIRRPNGSSLKNLEALRAICGL